MCADGLPTNSFCSPSTECDVMTVLLELVRKIVRDVFTCAYPSSTARRALS